MAKKKKGKGRKKKKKLQAEKEGPVPKKAKKKKKTHEYSVQNMSDQHGAKMGLTTKKKQKKCHGSVLGGWTPSEKKKELG